jgi:hypothetical protein
VIFVYDPSHPLKTNPGLGGTDGGVAFSPSKTD